MRRLTITAPNSEDCKECCSNTLIPKPPRRPKALQWSDPGCSLSDQMQVSDDEMNHFKRVACASARRHLVLYKRLFQQTQKALDAHVSEVIRLWPEIHCYQNHWPIEEYTLMYLKRAANSLRKLGRDKMEQYLSKYSTTKENSPPRASGVTLRPKFQSVSSKTASAKRSTFHSMYIGKPPPRNLTTSPTSAPLRGPWSTQRPTKQEPSIQSASVQPGSPLATRGRSAAQPLSSSPVQSSPSFAGSSAQPVIDFLKAAGLPPDVIFPKLREAGIEDMQRLSGLASLPDRNVWLDRHVELSHIDYKLLTEGLTKLCVDRQKMDRQD